MRLIRNRRQMGFESMEKRELFAADLGLNLASAAPAPTAEPAVIHFVEVAGGDSEATTSLDSFSFGVEREMKESGEKGGTEDINIGVGELQECTISKSHDDGSGSGEITSNSDQASADTFVKSWSTSGDADDRPTEELTFYYNKIVRG